MIKLGKNEYNPHYLGDKADTLFNYINKVLSGYNYYPEFYEKIKFLPPEDRKVAVANMLMIEFEPSEKMKEEVLKTVPCLQYLAHYCLDASYEDCDCINEENKEEWYNILKPFLFKKEVKFEGYDINTQIMMINEYRKKQGRETI